MALTLANVRRTAKSRYGLPYSTSEDPRFTDAMMLELINQAYAWFAAETLCCYDRDLTINLVNGTREYALDPTVIYLDVRTVSMQYYVAGPTITHKRLAYRTYADVIEQYNAPLEDTTTIASGVPLYFLHHQGKTSGNAKQITLVPAPSGLLNSAGADVTDSTRIIRYAAYVYPAELTSDSDNLAFDEPDVYRFIPAVCWHMAMHEASLGRADAPVALWERAAREEAAAFHRINLEGIRTPSRVAPIAISPAQEAEERRRLRWGGAN